MISLKCSRVISDFIERLKLSTCSLLRTSPGSTHTGTQQLLLATGAHENLLTRHFNTVRAHTSSWGTLFRRHSGAVQKTLMNTVEASGPLLFGLPTRIKKKKKTWRSLKAARRHGCAPLSSHNPCLHQNVLSWVPSSWSQSKNPSFISL